MPATISRISKKALLSGPPKSVKAFLSAAKISNELNVATKHLWFARNTYWQHQASQSPEVFAAKCVFLHRMIMLAGHAYECSVFLSCSSTRYIINNDSMQRFANFYAMNDAIRAYFSKPNLVASLRNRLSFHTDGSFLYETLTQMPDDYEFLVLNGPNLGHQIFMGVDRLIEEVLYGCVPSEDLPKAPLYKLASDQILQLTDIMGPVLQMLMVHVVGAILNLPLGNDVYVQIPKGPPIDEVCLPFFCEPPTDSELFANIMASASLSD